MIIFDESFENTMKFEGKYSNEKYDKGGKTFMGISKKYHPNWEGWETINKKNYNVYDLYLKVKKFYKKNYWNKIKGDKLMNQKLANKIFDLSVNMGIKTSIKFLQESLNLLNRNEKYYKNLKIDGIIGDKTLKALKIYLNNDNINYLLEIINILQGKKYLKIIKNDKTQEKFLRGWLKRVSLC